MQSAAKVTGARRLKRLKIPDYGDQIKTACERAGLGVKQFSRLAATLKRARAGLFIGYRKHVAILEAINKNLNPKIEVEYPWSVDATTDRENRDSEKLFQSYSRNNIYQSSAQLAEQMFKRCRKAKQFEEAAHWADHAAGEYRKQGNLNAALDCLNDCFCAMRQVKNREWRPIEMRLLSIRFRFELAVTQEYMALGEFSKALMSFRALDSEVAEILKLGFPEKLHGELLLRKIHNKRQQAEMLRLLGRYNEALCLMEQALKEYPDWADEARRQSELHRADSLRLLGDAEHALEIYERLEATARNRHQDGMLASVLWPKIGAIQGLKQSAIRRHKLKTALRDIANLAGSDSASNKYLFIYSRLVSVPSKINDAEAAHRLVHEAIQAGPLQPDRFRTEYAHVMLCRGEIHRRHNRPNAAKKSYAEALHYYNLMEMRWGIVRSTVGLNLVGCSCGLSPSLLVEGCDESFWARFQAGKAFPPGILCENIP